MSGLVSKAILALEDGTVFKGQAFGATESVAGEVCFNTSMTGYQEILTDPSYKGQIVTMTYPLIGNYGVNDQDIESYQSHTSGFVIRELSPVVSNYRSDCSLNEYMVKNKIPGIQGIDTRALTKKLRVRGSMNGYLTTEQDVSEEEALEKARDWPGLIGIDFVKEVTHKSAFEWDQQDQVSAAFRLPHGPTELDGRIQRKDLPAAEIPIVAYDFGVKYNILRMLRQQGFKVIVLPANTPAEEALRYNPAGIFLSNGPGDPSAVSYAAQAVAELIQKGLPIFGICLGHQILSLAMGGKTSKLKFGHRGANHPVKDLDSGRVEITSQNHGFTVDADSLPSEVTVNRIKLNDQPDEGLRPKNKPLYCVQYHPEASPGPHDSSNMFNEFRQLVEKHA